MSKKILNDLDDDGNMLDSLIYEIVTPETGILIGNRYYLRDSVLGLIKSNNPRDPYNNNNTLEYLMEDNENPTQPKNDKINTYLIIAVVFFFLYFFLIIYVFYVLTTESLKTDRIKTEIYLFCFYFLFFLFFIIPSKYSFEISCLISVLIIIFFIDFCVNNKEIFSSK